MRNMRGWEVLGGVMRKTAANVSATRRAPMSRALPRMLAATACSLALLGAGQARAQTGAQSGQSGTPVAATGVSVALEQCLTAPAQAERSATFSGEMVAIPGTTRMSMRVEVEEQAPGEASFHTLSATGLGVWRASDPKVKIYRYLKQVTNLSSPAVYRAQIHFRWLNAKGHVIKRAERATPRCAELSTSPSPPKAAEGLSVGSAALSNGA